MKLPVLEKTLDTLAMLIRARRFLELETDTLELKPVPADGGAWHQRHQSVNAFLNTRGGILILGIKESGTGPARRYEFTGWRPEAENRLKEIPKQFTDRAGIKLDVRDMFPPPQIVSFLDGHLAVVLVDELPSDRKFAFYQGTAYRRMVTGDHRLTDSDVDKQEEFREEAVHARELRPVGGATLDDFDLDQLNDYINRLNRPLRVETLKPDLVSARPFLERKSFLRDGRPTVLGMLVCGRHVVDHLGFRCQVHGYVDVPQEIARDKQDLVGNILPLMESSLAYILRNIQVGVSAEQGGTSRLQYPEELLRETVNNALAHRDYSNDRQVIIAIKPGKHIAISNPGSFRRHLLVEAPDRPLPLRRILPEAKPRNPKLADVLRVYRKWEGRGIGMATLVDLCLRNQIDLPYYRFRTDEVTLHLRPGQLLDERMDRLFRSFDAYLERKLQGRTITTEQKLVLAYLIKSEEMNEQVGYTILLTPDNNHFSELIALEHAGLIRRDPVGTSSYPVYVSDPELLRKDYLAELRGLYGAAFDGLDGFVKDVLGVVYRFTRFAKAGAVNAKQTSFSLWYEQGRRDDEIKAFEAFDRKVRRTFNKLAKAGFVVKGDGARYVLNERFLEGRLM